MYGQQHQQPTFVNPRRGMLTAVYCVLSALLLAMFIGVAVVGLPTPVTVVLMASQGFLIVAMALQIHLAWGYVKLTPEGIVVRTVRSRTLPWRGIAMIRTKPFWSNTVVEVRTADGRTRNLPAPAALSAKDGPRFAQEAALIQQWWAYCRGW